VTIAPRNVLDIVIEILAFVDAADARLRACPPSLAYLIAGSTIMRRPRSHDQARAQASRAGNTRHCRGSSSAQTGTSSRSPPCSACSAARSYPRSASYGPNLPQWRGVRSMCAGRVLAKQHRAKWRLPDVFTSPLEDMRVELEAGHTTVVDAVPFLDLFGKTAGRACCMSSGMVSGLPLIIRGDGYPGMPHAFSLQSVSYGRLQGGALP
jgi:hypothetical protein